MYFSSAAKISKLGFINIFKQQIVFNSTKSVKPLFSKKFCFPTNAGAKCHSYLGSDLLSPSRKTIGYWLLTCGGLTFGAIVIGGITRLTESGLSMVKWHPFKERPPLSHTEWENEFRTYQQYPEFKIKNPNISLSEFKFIWWMEYVHRMWGRLVGLVFVVPATVFFFRGWFPRKLQKRIVAAGILLGFQGLLGWYMVKSGLENHFHAECDTPRVSQYRLSAHLGTALILYSIFLWCGLDLVLPALKISNICSKIKRFRYLSHASKSLIFLTILSGSLVAGLDAGLVYNSFPKMGDWWVPPETFSLQPFWRNFTENPVTAQLNHRFLALSTFSITILIGLLSRKLHLPKRIKLVAFSLPFLSMTQVCIGICTLLYYVPVSLAAMHQSVAVLLLSAAVWLTHELKWVKRLPK